MNNIQKIYVNMCCDCMEIQKLWKPSIGDYYYHLEDRKVYLLTDKKINERNKCRWLPLEKQLYRIYFKHGASNWRKFDQSSGKYFDYLVRALGDHPSKEICSLSLIMQECYFKRWFNNKWNESYVLI